MLEPMMPEIRLPWPVDWSAEFGRDAPLLIEVGFGGGRYLEYLAQARPDANILGVEISAPSLRKAYRRLGARKNVRLIRTTAKAALWALCAPATVGGLYINFPDPWPKEAHAHRRLINHRFLQLAASRLVIGGALEIATDHPDYAEWIAACLSDSDCFRSRLPAHFVHADQRRPQTKYEKKALAAGRRCYYFQWQRDDAPAAYRFPVPAELPMPHATIVGGPDLQTISKRFSSRACQAEGITVRLIDALHSSSQPTLYFDTYIGEEPVDQRVLLALTQRVAGDGLVHLAEVGHPRPTRGIHLAVGCLVAWLLNMAPGARVTHHNLREIGQRQFDEV